MGLLDRLFGGGDPASKWVREPGLAVQVDLDAGTLCGVRLGLRPEELSKLGPPTNKGATEGGVWTWAKDGVSATATKGVLSSYLVAFQLPDEGFEEFRGSLLVQGKPQPFTSATGFEEILSLLGDPWHKYADPEDPDAPLTWFYELRGLEWEVEILASGLLAAISLHSPPSLAKPETRHLLRVEKPWPP